jgi:hypothetical protein
VQNTKFASAQQAKQMYQLKNIKKKLYKTNVAIWNNKTSNLHFGGLYCIIILQCTVQNTKKKNIQFFLEDVKRLAIIS